MSPLPCTTTAGRHAADVARARDRNLRRDLRDVAREGLAKAFQSHGLPVRTHFQPELEAERSLFVDCRLEQASADHAFIYAILDSQGWKSDRARLSRFRQGYDVLRLCHRQTNAILVVIVKVPFGEAPPLEAA